MKLRCTLSFLLAAAMPLRAAEPVKLSIAEMLKPETRMEALRQYLLQAQPKEAKDFGWKDPAEFGRWYSELTVARLDKKDGAPRYLLTWHIFNTLGGEEDWKANEGAPPLLAPAVLRSGNRVQYEIFSAEGTPLSETGVASSAIVSDFDGDGVVDVLSHASGTLNGVQDQEQKNAVRLPMAYEYFTLHGEDGNTEPRLAVLYNLHPASRGAGNTWRCQVRFDAAGGPAAIELGPMAGKGLEPQVVFHWDPAQGKWTGPAPRPGDHYRVLTGADPDGECRRLAESGEFAYSLQTATAGPGAPARKFETEAWKLTGEMLAKPYVAGSLAGLTNEQLLAYMSATRNAWDYVRERQAEATKLPELWTLDPPTAALAYVRRNRPASLDAAYELSLLKPEKGAAPAEGDLTLDDGPSGCFAPMGAYVHHLHCARDGSFLIYAETIDPWFGVPSTVSAARYEVRKLDLPFAQAQRIFQLVWWMSRVRAEPFGLESMEGATGFSTSHHTVVVQIASGAQQVTVEGTHCAPMPGTCVGAGSMTGGYDSSAFINLTVQLFAREIPELLGEPWQSQAVPRRWDDEANHFLPPTKTDLEQVRKKVAEVLKLAGEGKAAPRATEVAVEAVGRLGWRDLHGSLERLAGLVPPPFPYEKRVEALELEIDGWKEKFGEDASQRAYYNRRVAPLGLDLPGMGAPENPLGSPRPAAPRDPKFDALDALYDEKISAESNAPRSERDWASLRGSLMAALRQLEIHDDPAALEASALEENGDFRFALQRLAVLDPPRALKLLRKLESEEKNEANRAQWAQDREALEHPAPPVARKAGREERARLLATLRNPDAPAFRRQAALDALVPAGEPMRYPDPGIDRALREVFQGSDGAKAKYPNDWVALAMAARRGGAAWDDLAKRGLNGRSMDREEWHSLLTAMTLIAHRQPARRKTLHDMLAPEMRVTNGYINATLWSIWQLDLRDLKGEVERIATSGPEDYEGTLGNGWSSDRAAIDQRYHRARQIVALWNETDALTRARLHVLFGATNAATFADERNGALEHLLTQLQTACRGLSRKQLASLAELARWSSAAAAEKTGTPAAARNGAFVSAKLRARLGFKP